MSAAARPILEMPALSRLRRRAQARAAGRVLQVSLMPVIGLGVLGYQLGGGIAAVSAMAAGLLCALVFAMRAARRCDGPWLLRRLDALLPALEDSSALIASDAAPQSPLQTLQRERVRARLIAALSRPEPLDIGASTTGPRLRPALAAALLLVALALAWAPLRMAVETRHAATAAAADAAALTLSSRLTITPPAYTGLDPSTLTTLDLKAPADSRIAWSITPDRQVAALALRFEDGTRLDLRPEGRAWRGERTVAASTLYRVEIRDAPTTADRAYRIDAIPDAPPQVTVRAPSMTLNLLTPDQKSWALAFEARDDYGLGEARLTIALAQGSGDNIKTTEQTVVLEGRGDARSRRYDRTLDLGALGFAKGDDLIVRLSVADNRQPQPNVSSSASFILRWPPEKSTDSAAMEGPVQKTLPAYFRSQRQIIIDTEALQAQRGSLEARRFEKQSDELGVDQKVLRLRYGQFLGEGFETAAEHAPQAGKTGDTAPAVASESLKQIPDDGDSAPAASGVIGRQEDVLHEFGHAHDNAEAATLLDPETRRILKTALDEMWQAELRLRQAKPDEALPFEYKALDYIKQVQQAERIYLARAGLELPQVDAARRLSGKRDGLSDRAQTVPPAAVEASSIPALWNALDRGAPIDATALNAWLQAHPEATPDALGLLAAADRVQHEPACAACRVELKGRLWPLLPLPATAVASRTAPDAAGAAYLDALTAAPGAAP